MMWSCTPEKMRSRMHDTVLQRKRTTNSDYVHNSTYIHIILHTREMEEKKCNTRYEKEFKTSEESYRETKGTKI